MIKILDAKVKILFIISIVTLLLGVLLFFIKEIDSFIVAFFLSISFMTFFISILHLLGIESFSKKYPTPYSFVYAIIIVLFAILIPDILEKIIANWR